MEFIDEQLAKYVEEHTQPESDLLRKINRETHLEVLRPRMLSGHLQGRVLSMFSKMIQPKQVLEIGTYTGYSALCIAEGLAAGGKIITIDKNEELEERVKKYFSESPYKGQIDFRVGDALAIIPELKEDFDLVFIDADKANYLNYFNLVIDRLHSDAYLIADNVLWSGKVIEQVEEGDVDTHALIEFNKAMQHDNRVENVLFPIRDGLMVIRKI